VIRQHAGKIALTNLIVSLFATFFVIIKNYSIIAEKKKKAMDGESMGVPNRLISEKSPYLLQHAYNAVDWYPRGDEAFRGVCMQDPGYRPK